MARLDFNLKNDIVYKIKNDLESPLIFVLFLKGKQNKKENPKCDSLYGKCDLQKTGLDSGVRLHIG